MTAKATDPAGNVSDASDPMVATTDTEAPAKPSISTDLTDKAGTKTPVEVTAEPGTKVELFDKDGNKIGEATADNNGKATITPTVAIPAGNVTAKATDAAGNTSDASDPMVATTDTTAPAKPVVNPVKAGDTAVTGTAEAGSTVEVTLPDGTKVSAIADQDGNFSVPVSGLKEGNQVSVTATDNAGNKSPKTEITVASGVPTVTEVIDLSNLTEAEKEKVSEEVRKVNRAAREIKVSDDGTAVVTFPDGSSVTYTPEQTIKKADITAPTAPIVNPVKAGDTTVTGTVEAGSTVEVTLPDGSKVSTKADQDGNYSVPVSGLKEGDTVSVTATDEAGNKSDATTATVVKASDKAKDADGIKEPATKTPVKDTSTLTEDEKGKVKDAVSAANPTATNVEVGTDGTATVTFPDGSTATLTGDKTVYVSENGELPDSIDLPKLIITKWVDENGNELKPTDAKAPVELGGTNEAFEHGEIEGYVFVRTVTDKVEGTATHIFKRVKAEADTIAPDAPVVNPVKAGATEVTGTAESGSTVEVTLPDGSKVSATADQDGNFSVPVSGLKEGDTVSVTATDKAGNTSNPTSVTVGKGTDTTAPTAPVVNPVKTGTTAVTGTAEAGSTVEVTLPDGSKVSAKADQDGNYSVPVSGLKEGDIVSVTATDEAGNTSSPTSVTVGKGLNTIAPSAPVVNTDLTGKAGTRTPIDVIAEPGTKIELFDKDGNKIGEATADTNGKATIIPTVAIPEGNVTARATDAAGNVSDASAPMLATRGGSTDTFNNSKGSNVTPTVVKPSPAVDVQAVDSSDKHMNLKARATISAAQKDTSTLPATGEEASAAAVVLGGVLAAFGLTLAGKRKKED